MAVPVDVYVRSDDSLAALLPGVTVGVFDPTTEELVAQVVSDADGKAALLLPGTAEGKLYHLRLFKLGVVFGGVRGIAVQEPAVTTNKFDAFGTVLTMPVASDPNLCRCTGRFVNFANKPIANCVVRISARAEYGFETPKVVDGNLVASEGMHFQTDANGILTIDLFRGGKYWITFSGEDDTVWPLYVPHRSSANLVELIHPSPVSVTWATGNDITLAVGELIILPVSVTFSNYRVVTTDLPMWVDIMNSSPEVVSVQFSAQSPNCIAIMALAVGTAQVTAQPKTTIQPSRVPAPATLMPPLNVTVLP